MSRSNDSIGEESPDSARSSAVSSPEPFDEPLASSMTLKPSYIDCSDESLKGEKALLHLAGRSLLLFTLVILLPLLAGVFVVSRNAPETMSFLMSKDFLTRPRREKFPLATTAQGTATNMGPRRFRPIMSNKSPDAPMPLVEKNAPEFVLPELVKFFVGRTNGPHKAEYARCDVETPPPPHVERVRPKSIRDMIRAPTQPPKVASPSRYTTIRIGGSRRGYSTIRFRRAAR